MPKYISLVDWSKKHGLTWVRTVNHLRANRLVTAKKRQVRKTIWTISEDEMPPTAS